MSNINLQEGKIYFDGNWLTADEITSMIQQKMNSGDLKFAGLAAALEELNKAIESSHTLEQSIVMSKEDYEKLLALGGGDEKESIRKAIMAYIGEDKQETVMTLPQAPPKEKETSPQAQSEEDEELAQVQSKDGKPVKCANCKAMITIPSDERPIVLECPKCGTNYRLTL